MSEGGVVAGWRSSFHFLDASLDDLLLGDSTLRTLLMGDFRLVCGLEVNRRGERLLFTGDFFLDTGEGVCFTGENCMIVFRGGSLDFLS